MERGRRASELRNEKVCNTCGHTGFSFSIATCSRCKVSFQHTYCMRFASLEIPEEWSCEECLFSAEAVGNRHVTEKQEEAIKAMGSTYTKQEMQQFSHKLTSRKVEAGKVKFITNEEVIILASGKRPRNQFVPGNHGDLVDFKLSPKTSKIVTPAVPSSKVINPPYRPEKGPVYTGIGISSKQTTETKSDNMRRGTETTTQVCKIVPAKFKGTRPNVVSRDVDSQHADDRRITMASKHIENRAPLDPQDDCFFLKKVSANGSLVIKEEHKKIEANRLPANNSGNTESFHPLKLVAISDEKHHHALEACWRGAFEVPGLDHRFHGRVCGYLSCQVSPKVYDISKQFPQILQFQLLSRESVWPKIFKLSCPTKDDVALYFMCEAERHKEKYAHLIQLIDSHDYALKGCIADAELLLFTSAKLQIDSQKFGGCIYLWSVFRPVKLNITSHGDEKNVSCSTFTPGHFTHDKSKTPPVSSLDSNSKVNMVLPSPMEVDMEIDMEGGHPVGIINSTEKLEDASFGLPKPIQRPPASISLEKPNNSEFLDSPPGFPIPRYKRSNLFASMED